MRVALYARVSTEEQAEKFGLASQLTELRAFAIKRDYTVLHEDEFFDEGFSGADLNRPALNRLREAVRMGAFRLVLVYAPDRLSRRLGHQIFLHEEFEHAGVRVEFVTVRKEDTSEGRLLMNVMGSIAEYEREKIRERTMRGKREKAHRGLVPAGAPPYGYQSDPTTPGKLVIHKEQASVVGMIFRLLVEEQRSIRAITTELRRLAVRPPRGQQWAPSSVRRILTDQLYAGRAFFNKRERVPGKTPRIRPQSEWLPILIPPIVDRHFFDRAQAQLYRNREHLTGRPSVQFYLLRGLLRCGTCKRKFAGGLSHGKRRYRCTGHDRLYGPDRCCARSLRAESVETLIWSAIVNVLRNPALLAEKFGAYRIKLGIREVEVRSEVEHLTLQIAEVGHQEEKLLELYLDDQMDKSILRSRLETFRRQKMGLQERLDRAKQQVARQEAEEARQDAIDRFCAVALRGLDNLAPEGRQRLLRALVDEIVMWEEAVEIHGVLPGRRLPPDQDENWTDHAHDRPARRG